MTAALITPGMARRERDRLDVEFILASIRSRVGHESADVFAALVGALITHANQQTATAELLLIAADPRRILRLARRSRDRARRASRTTFRNHPQEESTMTTKKTDRPKMYRQGDVLIVAVDSIPTVATEIARDAKRGIVLAEGEVTGHAHRIPSRCANLYRTEMDARYMRVTAPVQLKHEEHSTVTIPAGNYRVTIHHEYSPAAIQRVAD